MWILVKVKGVVGIMGVCLWVPTIPSLVLEGWTQLVPSNKVLCHQVLDGILSLLREYEAFFLEISNVVSLLQHSLILTSCQEGILLMVQSTCNLGHRSV